MPDTTPLSQHWSYPRDNIKNDPVYTHILARCKQALNILLRKIGIYLQDPGTHNVLFDMVSGRVVLVDFEMYGSCGGFLERVVAREVVDEEVWRGLEWGFLVMLCESEYIVGFGGCW